MNLRRLGQSDLEITPVGIGAWAIGGGKWEFAWGAQNDTESLAALGPIQTCDTCIVEVDGKLVRACSAVTSAGMKVSTTAGRARAARTEAFDRLLRDHELCPCNALMEKTMLGHAGFLTGFSKPVLGSIVEVVKGLDSETGYTAILGLSEA